MLRIAINLAAQCLAYILLKALAEKTGIGIIVGAGLNRNSVISIVSSGLAGIIKFSFYLGVFYALLRLSGRRGKKMDWYYENIPFGYIIPLSSGQEHCEKVLQESEPSSSETIESPLSQEENVKLVSPKTTTKEYIIASAVFYLTIIGTAVLFSGWRRVIPILICILIFEFIRAKFFNVIERQVFPEAQNYYKEQSVQKVIFIITAIVLLLYAARFFWLASQF